MMLTNLESKADTIATTQFIEEISIIIAAQNLTPTMMSQDFLKFSGIIPKEWELAQQPVLNPSFAQLNFQNGLSLVAQPRSITLSESLNNKQLSAVQSAEVAVRYIEKLPHAEYLGVSFSPKILVPFPQNPVGVRQYITGNLLGTGSWKQIGNFPVQAGINLMYKLDRCQLTIAISEARIQQTQQSQIAALLFAGNFNYNLNQNHPSQSTVEQLTSIINNWQNDLHAFREIVQDKFLAANDSISESSYASSLFPGQTL